jgi:hypothetical protein
VPLNHIANCGLGTIAHRHVTRIFFPALYQEGVHHPAISQKNLAMLYDQCIRPAVMQVIPAAASHWPVNYDAAFQQAKDTRGQLHLGTVAVPARHLVAFCSALRSRLDHIEEFKGAFFCHELRGHKGGTAHEEDDEGRSYEEAFETFFDNIDMARIDEGNWLVDVGLEIQDPGRVVNWSKLAHSEILKYLLPSLDDDKIDKLQERRTFHLDPTAHLHDFAGFRCEPGTWGRVNNVEYINVYTTDKCPTYQLHRGIWRRRSSEDLLPQTLDKLLVELDAMSKTYKSCCGSRAHLAQEGCARLEIRVPLRAARTALRDVPYESVQQWTFSVKPKVWW